MRSAKGVVTGFEDDGSAGPSPFLLEVTALLQPQPVTKAPATSTPATTTQAPADSPGSTRGRAGSARTHRLLVLPNARAPRVLLPSGPARVSRGLIGAQAVTRSRGDRLMRWGAGAAISLGLSSLLSRSSVELLVDDGIEEQLGALLGCPVRVGVRLGPPRANRKPVLLVSDLHGSVLAFAKLGVSDLTDRLVEAEAAALRTVGGQGLTVVRVPELLDLRTWGGHALHVQSALPVRGTGSSDPALIARAIVEVATAGGVTEAALDSSPFADGLRGALAAIDDAFADELRAAAAIVLADPTVLAFGAWHGDWSPSNMLCSNGQVLLWDWERYASGVPIGLDAVHLAFSEGVTRRGLSHGDSAQACVAQARQILDPVGVPAGQAELVAVLALLAVGTRYASDRQLEAGGKLGRLDAWLIPVLHTWAGGRTPSR